MHNVSIKYGDVAPEAKESFEAYTNDSAFDTLEQLQKYNLAFPNYENPCESYAVALDGEAVPFPSNPENSNVGFWSKALSGADGTFGNPVVITLESDQKFASSGFTFTFDTLNDVYPTHINISWYEDDISLSNMDFYPNNSNFSCQNKVDFFNKVVITFTALNMPFTRLKLRSIDYGYGTYFYGENLRNVRLIQEIDPISSNISINTADFTIDVPKEYFFQSKQPISIYHNGKLKATTFIKDAKRKSKFLWQIQSEDYIGLLDGTPYYGGMYVNAKAVNILKDIFDVAKVPYTIDEVFLEKVITGYIPYTTCRDALMQVAFAIQAVVDTSNSEVVKIFNLEEEVKQTIPLERIMQGQSFNDEEVVTGVEVVAHSYKPIVGTVDVYDAAESGAGQNIFVRFNEPLHDLSIENGAIIQSGTNYAVINANVNCILTGQKYEHTTQIKRKNNTAVLAGNIEKVVAVDNATLVSVDNIDNVLDKCYNYLTKTRTTLLKIVEARHISGGDYARYGSVKYGAAKYGGKTKKIVTYDMPTNVGENINAKTEYLGNVVGRIIEQSFSLSGGTIIKDTTMKGE